MSSAVFEIARLSNGDVVLRDADEGGEPLVRIRFSRELQDMLGDDAVPVAEAMIEAATDFIAGDEDDADAFDRVVTPVVH